MATVTVEDCLPTLHLNGTSKDSLIEQLCDVSNALETAYQAMKEATPNGRDYYPQGPAAFMKAQNAHDDRMRRLDAIKKEIDDRANAIEDIARR